MTISSFEIMATELTYRQLEADTNKNAKVTTDDMIFTLWVNVFMFVVFMITFEGTRHIKQVYLRRLQKRFEV